MPLRAQISVVPQAFQTRTSVDLKDTIKPLPTDTDREDVVFDSIYGLRTIELNRPSKDNALNGSMIRKIVSRLVEWERSDLANVIVIKGAGEKAFCAGGDVVVLAEQNMADRNGWLTSAEYFELEYRLNHYIATYTKPYLAFMDGITMGGGVGLSIHAPFRVATERTVFAMPETKIGFFPDVGASFFLPRLNGGLGKYLALTSETVTGADVFYSGIATHYIHSTTLPLLEGRLAELRFRDYDTMPTRLRLINDTLEEYATGLPPKQPMAVAGDARKAIDRCFSRRTIPEIIAELQRLVAEAEVPSEELPPELEYVKSQRDWALKTINTLQKRSPTALHVTARLMEEGKDLTISQAFKREYQLAAKFMQHGDFNEGVMKLLGPGRRMDPKPEPIWNPPTLEALPSPVTATAWFFKQHPNEGVLTLFDTQQDYKASPYPHVALPKENWLRKTLLDQGTAIKNMSDAVELVVKMRGVRQGLREVVKEMITRCVKFKPGGGIEWTGGDIDVVLAEEQEPVVMEDDVGVVMRSPAQKQPTRDGTVVSGSAPPQASRSGSSKPNTSGQS